MCFEGQVEDNGKKTFTAASTARLATITTTAVVTSLQKDKTPDQCAVYGQCEKGVVDASGDSPLQLLTRKTFRIPERPQVFSM